MQEFRIQSNSGEFRLGISQLAMVPQMYTVWGMSALVQSGRMLCCEVLHLQMPPLGGSVPTERRPLAFDMLHLV
jgi:hypothetical protein